MRSRYDRDHDDRPSSHRSSSDHRNRTSSRRIRGRSRSNRPDHRHRRGRSRSRSRSSSRSPSRSQSHVGTGVANASSGQSYKRKRGRSKKQSDHSRRRSQSGSPSYSRHRSQSLPPRWKMKYSESRCRYFFFNTKTKQTQWSPPKASQVAASVVGSSSDGVSSSGPVASVVGSSGDGVSSSGPAASVVGSSSDGVSYTSSTEVVSNSGLSTSMHDMELSEASTNSAQGVANGAGGNDGADILLPESIVLPPTLPPSLLNGNLGTMISKLSEESMKTVLSEFNEVSGIFDIRAHLLVLIERAQERERVQRLSIWDGSKKPRASVKASRGVGGRAAAIALLDESGATKVLDETRENNATNHQAASATAVTSKAPSRLVSPANVLTDRTPRKHSGATADRKDMLSHPDHKDAGRLIRGQNNRSPLTPLDTNRAEALGATATVDSSSMIASRSKHCKSSRPAEKTAGPLRPIGRGNGASTTAVTSVALVSPANIFDYQIPRKGSGATAEQNVVGGKARPDHRIQSRPGKKTPGNVRRPTNAGGNVAAVTIAAASMTDAAPRRSTPSGCETSEDTAAALCDEIEYYTSELEKVSPICKIDELTLKHAGLSEEMYQLATERVMPNRGDQREAIKLTQDVLDTFIDPKCTEHEELTEKYMEFREKLADMTLKVAPHLKGRINLSARPDAAHTHVIILHYTTDKCRKECEKLRNSQHEDERNLYDEYDNVWGGNGCINLMRRRLPAMFHREAETSFTDEDEQLYWNRTAVHDLNITVPEFKPQHQEILDKLISDLGITEAEYFLLTMAFIALRAKICLASNGCPLRVMYAGRNPGRLRGTPVASDDAMLGAVKDAGHVSHPETFLQAEKYLMGLFLHQPKRVLAFARVLKKFYITIPGSRIDPGFKTTIIEFLLGIGDCGADTSAILEELRAAKFQGSSDGGINCFAEWKRIADKDPDDVTEQEQKWLDNAGFTKLLNGGNSDGGNTTIANWKRIDAKDRGERTKKEQEWLDNAGFTKVRDIQRSTTAEFRRISAIPVEDRTEKEKEWIQSYLRCISNASIANVAKRERIVAKDPGKRTKKEQEWLDNAGLTKCIDIQRSTAVEIERIRALPVEERTVEFERISAIPVEDRTKKEKEWMKYYFLRRTKNIPSMSSGSVEIEAKCVNQSCGCIEIQTPSQADVCYARHTFRPIEIYTARNGGPGILKETYYYEQGHGGIKERVVKDLRTNSQRVALLLSNGGGILPANPDVGRTEDVYVRFKDHPTDKVLVLEGCGRRGCKGDMEPTDMKKQWLCITRRLLLKQLRGAY